MLIRTANTVLDVRSVSVTELVLTETSMDVDPFVACESNAFAAYSFTSETLKLSPESNCKYCTDVACAIVLASSAGMEIVMLVDVTTEATGAAAACGKTAMNVSNKYN